MILRGSKPALAAKARLRRDSKNDSWLLLYPERGLSLSPTAASILKACDGERTVDAIVEELLREYTDRSAADVRADVLDFLEQMAKRGLVVVKE